MTTSVFFGGASLTSILLTFANHDSRQGRYKFRKEVIINHAPGRIVTLKVWQLDVLTRVSSVWRAPGKIVLIKKGTLRTVLGREHVIVRGLGDGERGGNGERGRDEERGLERAPQSLRQLCLGAAELEQHVVVDPEVLLADVPNEERTRVGIHADAAVAGDVQEVRDEHLRVRVSVKVGCRLKGDAEEEPE